MQKSNLIRSVARVMLIGFTLGAMAIGAADVRADSISGATAGVQVQNLDANPATLSFQAVDQAGNVVKNFTDPTQIPGNSSRTYFPLDTIGLTSSFNGSLVVSSDKAVAAIANINATSGSGVPVAASYGGVSNGAPLLTLPLIMKNNGAKKFDTTFNVQNAGQSDTTVTVTYIPAAADSGNTGCTQSATIKAGASATFNQNADTSYTGCAGLTTGGGKFVGSAKVQASANINIASAVLEASQINLLAYTGFGPTQASNTPTFPLVNANNNGNQTGIQIANLGTQDTDVTVSYKASAGSGTDCAEKQTVKAGSSTTFALIAFANNSLGAAENCADAPTKFVGSGTVTANSAAQPLVAVINQTNNAKGFGSAYGSFNASSATDKVSMPLVMDFNGKFHVFSGISVVNVGNAAVDIKCTYSTQNGNTPAPDTATGVAPGGSLVVVHNNKLHTGSTSYVGSADCVATGAGEKKIVGVVNQTPALLSVGGAPAGDKLLTYEGFSH